MFHVPVMVEIWSERANADFLELSAEVVEELHPELPVVQVVQTHRAFRLLRHKLPQGRVIRPVT